jgi:hypothetical protein
MEDHPLDHLSRWAASPLGWHRPRASGIGTAQYTALTGAWRTASRLAGGLGCGLALVLGTAVGSAPSHAQPTAATPMPAADQRRQIQVAEGPLSAALAGVARSGNLLLMIRPGQLDGLSTRGLSGRYTPVQAMERLLVGSGFELTDLPGGGYALRPVTSTVQPAPPAPAAPAPATPASGG